MGYYRHILAPHLPVDAISLAIDETRVALRFLAPLNSSDENRQRSVGNASDLITTKKLACSYSRSEESARSYEIFGRKYFIFAEGILDKRDEEFARLWNPGTHFEIHFDPYHGMRVDAKGALTGKTRRNTAELIRYMGGLWVFGLWVRNPETPVNLCSRSITTAPNTILITNLTELGETQSADYVMEGGRSKWLSLKYRITPKCDFVSQDGTMEYTFEVLDGKTGEVATDVSWDGWRLEAVDGYAPRRRISVKNGVGHFRVQALGLLSGETMRVKVQSLLDPSLAECTISVL